MKKLTGIFMMIVGVVFFMNTGNVLAGKAMVSHDWQQESQNKNPELSKQITVLVDRLRALESALVEAKANGSRMANNIRGGIVNLRHVMETIYEPLGGKANVQKRLENAYKGVGNRRGMVENMFKRAKFPNATALANEFKAILSDLDGLRPALEKAIL